MLRSLCLPQAMPDKKTMPPERLVGLIQQNVIGADATIQTPFGSRALTYADYTASGRCVGIVEDFLRRDVLPMYANTHTELSATGRQTNHYREEARAIVQVRALPAPRHGRRRRRRTRAARRLTRAPSGAALLRAVRAARQPGDVRHALCGHGHDGRARQADRLPRHPAAFRARQEVQPLLAHPAGGAPRRVRGAHGAPLERAALARVDRRRARDPRAAVGRDGRHVAARQARQASVQGAADAYRLVLGGLERDGDQRGRGRDRARVQPGGRGVHRRLRGRRPVRADERGARGRRPPRRARVLAAQVCGRAGLGGRAVRAALAARERGALAAGRRHHPLRVRRGPRLRRRDRAARGRRHARHPAGHPDRAGVPGAQAGHAAACAVHHRRRGAEGDRAVVAPPQPVPARRRPRLLLRVQEAAAHRLVQRAAPARQGRRGRRAAEPARAEGARETQAAVAALCVHRAQRPVRHPGPLGLQLRRPVRVPTGTGGAAPRRATRSTTRAEDARARRPASA